MRRDDNLPQFPSPGDVERLLQKTPIGNTVQQNTMPSNDKPLFLVQNFNLPSHSGYNCRPKSFLPSGKRKSSSESLFPPRPKQCITEERIASSMQQLNLNAHAPLVAQNRPPVPSSSRTIDEGFYEDYLNDSPVEDIDDVDSGNDEDDVVVSSTSNDMWGKRFTFAPGVKEALNSMDNFALPNKIVQEMNKPSLALVPYQPLFNDFKLNVHNDSGIELVFNTNKTKNSAQRQDFANNNNNNVEDERMEEDGMDKL